MITSILKPRPPKPPPLRTVTPEEAQTAATAGNLAALPQATALGREVDTAMLEAFRRAAEQFAPGSLGAIQKSTAAFSRGEIPEDMAGAVGRAATAKSLGLVGTGGGGFRGNLTARDLGLTSLDLMGRGLQQFGALASLAPRPFDITSAFFTPGQWWQMTTENVKNKWNVDWLGKQMKYMGDVQEAEMWGQIAETGFQLLMSVAGGGFGGIAGKAAGAGTSMTSMNAASATGGGGALAGWGSGGSAGKGMNLGGY